MLSRLPRLWQHSIAGLGLLILAAVAYAPLCSPGNAPASIYSDVIAVHLGLKQFGFDTWHSQRRFPFWQDYQFAGGPALTNPQALYLHPLHVAFLFLPPAAALGLTFVLQLWAAGFGCYALARTLRLEWFASFFAGAAGLLAWKGIVSVEAGWLVPLATMALVPWWTLGLVRVAEQPDAARTLQLAGLVAAGLAGANPQPLYYACLLFVPYALYLGGTASRRAQRLLLMAAGLLLGVACDAYLWLPVLRERGLLAREGANADYAFFLSGHGLDLARLASLITPDGFGSIGPEPWEETAYFGGLPFGLALLGCLTSPARSTQRYVAYAFGATLWLSVDTPLLRAVYHVVPGYSAFRLPARILFLSVYLGVALAGAGLARVVSMLTARDRPRLALGVAGAAFAIVIAEGMYLARTGISVAPQALLGPDADHPLHARRSERDPPARTAVLGRGTLNYGWAQALQLRLINGYDPYNYLHYRRYLGLVRDGSSVVEPGNWVDLTRVSRPDLLDQLAVRTVVAQQPLASPALELRAHYPRLRNFVMYHGLQFSPIYVYENHDARAYARFASAVVALPSLEAVAQTLQATRLAEQAYVVGPPAESVPAAAEGGDPPSVQVERATAGAIALRVATGARRLLVIAESYNPGWRIAVDGRPVPPIQVDLALLGVWVAPGSRHVELEFVPLGFELGAAISALALLSLLGSSAFAVVIRWRRVESRV